MRKSHPLLKVIASTLVISFTLSDVSFAAPLVFVPNDLVHNPNLLQIPQSAAKITDIYSAKGANGKFIIHIQDAHTNAGAQGNISKVLEALIQKYKVKTIFLEGGTKDDTLSFLRPLAPKEKREEVAKKYLMSGEINGAEFLNLSSDYDMKLWGVEQGELYKKNLKSYASIVQKREAVLPYIEEIEKRLESLKRQIFPKDIVAFDEFLQKFEKKEKNFTEYYTLLSDYAGRYKINLLGFPHFLYLKTLKEKEDRIDFKKANTEQEALVNVLFKDEADRPEAIRYFLSRFGKMKSDSLTPLPFYEALFQEAGKKKINAGAFGNLVLYHDYLKSYSVLDLDEFLKEIQSLEEEVYKNSLKGNEAAAYLHQISDYLKVLKKLFLLQSSKDEFLEYSTDRKDVRYETIVLLAFLNKRLCDRGNYADVLRYLSLIEDNRKEAEDFYRTNEERDRVFLDKALKKMQKDKTDIAVLITGGYHTPNLKEMMKKEGVSYAVVTPHVSEETNIQKYEQILLGQLGNENPLLKKQTVDTGKKEDSMIVAELLEVWRQLSFNAVRNDLNTAELAQAPLVISSEARNPVESTPSFRFAFNPSVFADWRSHLPFVRGGKKASVSPPYEGATAEGSGEVRLVAARLAWEKTMSGSRAKQVIQATATRGAFVQVFLDSLQIDSSASALRDDRVYSVGWYRRGDKYVFRLTDVTQEHTSTAARLANTGESSVAGGVPRSVPSLTAARLSNESQPSPATASQPALAARLAFQEEKTEAAKIAGLLTTPLNAPSVQAAQAFLQGGYGQIGWGVPHGAAIDGPHATKGNQGYFTEDAVVLNGETVASSGKEFFLKSVKNMRDFFDRRNKKLAAKGKSIKLVIKPGIGGQHTPFQGIADVFQVIDPTSGGIVGEYELGKDFEASIQTLLNRYHADWDEVAVIPSSKSGSTDETMIIFSELFYILLKHAAERQVITGEAFADLVFETLHEVNFPDGKERKGADLFKVDQDRFGITSLIELVSQRSHQAGGLQLGPAQVKTIFAEVLGNMFFETTDRPDQSRLSAFIRNSGLGDELGDDAPGFGAMFDNVGGRWTADLHMMTYLAYHKLDAERYWEIRRRNIEEIRVRQHLGSQWANRILDEGITDIALVVPDEYFWFGKAIEQNFNESVWQRGFANLVAIRQSDWEAQKKYYYEKNRFIINLSDLRIEGKMFHGNAFNVVELPLNKNLDKQMAADQFGFLFSTFYGMTATVGQRLIARALLEAGKKASDVDINDLYNPATRIVQENLYLRQPYVELGKGLLEKELSALQVEEAKTTGAIARDLERRKLLAREGELQTNFPMSVSSANDVESLAKAMEEAALYAKINGRKFVPFLYKEPRLLKSRTGVSDALLGGVLFGVLVPGVPNNASNDGKHDNRRENYIQSLFRIIHWGYSLLSKVAMTKQTKEATTPYTNIPGRNGIEGDANGPITSPSAMYLPMSYKGLANSLRWLWSKSIRILDVRVAQFLPGVNQSFKVVRKEALENSLTSGPGARLAAPEIQRISGARLADANPHSAAETLKGVLRERTSSLSSRASKASVAIPRRIASPLARNDGVGARLAEKGDTKHPIQRFGLFVEKIQQGSGYGRDKYSIEVIKPEGTRIILKPVGDLFPTMSAGEFLTKVRTGEIRQGKSLRILKKQAGLIDDIQFEKVVGETGSKQLLYTSKGVRTQSPAVPVSEIHAVTVFEGFVSIRNQGQGFLIHDGAGAFSLGVRVLDLTVAGFTSDENVSVTLQGWGYGDTPVSASLKVGKRYHLLGEKGQEAFIGVAWAKENKVSFVFIAPQSFKVVRKEVLEKSSTGGSGARMAANNVGKLLLQEGKKDGGNNADLPHTKNEHPFNELGLRILNFGIQLSNTLFEALFGDFQSGFLRLLADLVENLGQRLGTGLSESFGNDLGQGNDRHRVMERYHDFPEVSSSRLLDRHNGARMAESYKTTVHLPETDAGYNSLDIEIRRPEGDVSKSFELILVAAVDSKKETIQFGMESPRIANFHGEIFRTSITDFKVARSFVNVLAADIDSGIKIGAWKNPFGDEYGQFKQRLRSHPFIISGARMASISETSLALDRFSRDFSKRTLEIRGYTRLQKAEFAKARTLLLDIKRDLKGRPDEEAIRRASSKWHDFFSHFYFDYVPSLTGGYSREIEQLDTEVYGVASQVRRLVASTYPKVLLEDTVLLLSFAAKYAGFFHEDRESLDSVKGELMKSLQSGDYSKVRALLEEIPQRVYRDGLLDEKLQILREDLLARVDTLVTGGEAANGARLTVAEFLATNPKPGTRTQIEFKSAEGEPIEVFYKRANKDEIAYTTENNQKLLDEKADLEVQLRSIIDGHVDRLLGGGSAARLAAEASTVMMLLSSGVGAAIGAVLTWAVYRLFLLNSGKGKSPQKEPRQISPEQFEFKKALLPKFLTPVLSTLSDVSQFASPGVPLEQASRYVNEALNAGDADSAKAALRSVWSYIQLIRFRPIERAGNDARTRIALRAAAENIDGAYQVLGEEQDEFYSRWALARNLALALGDLTVFLDRSGTSLDFEQSLYLTELGVRQWHDSLRDLIKRVWTARPEDIRLILTSLDGGAGKLLEKVKADSLTDFQTHIRAALAGLESAARLAAPREPLKDFTVLRRKPGEAIIIQTAPLIRLTYVKKVEPDKALLSIQKGEEPADPREFLKGQPTGIEQGITVLATKVKKSEAWIGVQTFPRVRIDREEIWRQRREAERAQPSAPGARMASLLETARVIRMTGDEFEAFVEGVLAGYPNKLGQLPSSQQAAVVRFAEGMRYEIPQEGQAFDQRFFGIYELLHRSDVEGRKKQLIERYRRSVETTEAFSWDEGVGPVGEEADFTVPTKTPASVRVPVEFMAFLAAFSPGNSAPFSTIKANAGGLSDERIVDLLGKNGWKKKWMLNTWTKSRSGGRLAVQSVSIDPRVMFGALAGGVALVLVFVLMVFHSRREANSEVVAALYDGLQRGKYQIEGKDSNSVAGPILFYVMTLWIGKKALPWLEKRGWIQSPAGQKLQPALNDGDIFSTPGPDGARLADVTELAKGLKASNPGDRRAAAISLGLLGGGAEQAVPELIRLLDPNQEPAHEVRIAAAKALGQIKRRATDVVPALARSLETNRQEYWRQDNYVQQAAAEALGEFGPAAKTAVPQLSAALRHKIIMVRIAAARAIGRIGPNAREASADLAAALDVNVQSELLVAISGALGGIGPDARASAAPALVRHLNDDNFFVGVASALALSRIAPETEGVVRVLVRGLEDVNFDRRQGSAEAISRIGPPAKEKYPKLPQVLVDVFRRTYRQEVRTAILNALLAIQAEPALILPGLKAALSDPNEYVRRDAALFLRGMGPAAGPAVPELIEKLKDGYVSVRIAAVRALREIGPSPDESINVLIEALRDKSQAVRRGAAQILADMGEKAKKAAPALREAMLAQPSSVHTIFKWAEAQVNPPPGQAARLAQTEKIKALLRLAYEAVVANKAILTALPSGKPTEAMAAAGRADRRIKDRRIVLGALREIDEQGLARPYNKYVRKLKTRSAQLRRSAGARLAESGRVDTITIRTIHGLDVTGQIARLGDSNPIVREDAISQFVKFASSGGWNSNYWVVQRLQRVANNDEPLANVVAAEAAREALRRMGQESGARMAAGDIYERPIFQGNTADVAAKLRKLGISSAATTGARMAENEAEVVSLADELTRQGSIEGVPSSKVKELIAELDKRTPNATYSLNGGELSLDDKRTAILPAKTALEEWKQDKVDPGALFSIHWNAESRVFSIERTPVPSVVPVSGIRVQEVLNDIATKLRNLRADRMHLAGDSSQLTNIDEQIRRLTEQKKILRVELNEAAQGASASSRHTTGLTSNDGARMAFSESRGESPKLEESFNFHLPTLNSDNGARMARFNVMARKLGETMPDAELRKIDEVLGSAARLADVTVISLMIHQGDIDRAVTAFRKLRRTSNFNERQFVEVIAASDAKPRTYSLERPISIFFDSNRQSGIFVARAYGRALIGPIRGKGEEPDRWQNLVDSFEIASKPSRWRRLWPWRKEADLVLDVEGVHFKLEVVGRQEGDDIRIINLSKQGELFVEPLEALTLDKMKGYLERLLEQSGVEADALYRHLQNELVVGPPRTEEDINLGVVVGKILGERQFDYDLLRWLVGQLEDSARQIERTNLARQLETDFSAALFDLASDVSETRMRGVAYSLNQGENALPRLKQALRQNPGIKQEQRIRAMIKLIQSLVKDQDGARLAAETLTGLGNVQQGPSPSNGVFGNGTVPVEPIEAPARLLFGGRMAESYKGTVHLPETEAGYSSLDIEIRRSQSDVGEPFELILVPTVDLKKQEDIFGVEPSKVVAFPSETFKTLITDFSVARSLVTELVASINDKVQTGAWKNPFGGEYGQFKDELRRYPFIISGARLAAATTSVIARSAQRDEARLPDGQAISSGLKAEIATPRHSTGLAMTEKSAARMAETKQFSMQRYANGHTEVEIKTTESVVAFIRVSRIDSGSDHLKIGVREVDSGIAIRSVDPEKPLELDLSSGVRFKRVTLARDEAFVLLQNGKPLATVRLSGILRANKNTNSKANLLITTEPGVSMMEGKSTAASAEGARMARQLDRLLQALTSDDGRTRRVAAKVLGQKRSPRAVMPLVRALRMAILDSLKSTPMVLWNLLDLLNFIHVAQEVKYIPSYAFGVVRQYQIINTDLSVTVEIQTDFFGNVKTVRMGAQTFYAEHYRALNGILDALNERIKNAPSAQPTDKRAYSSAARLAAESFFQDQQALRLRAVVVRYQLENLKNKAKFYRYRGKTEEEAFKKIQEAIERLAAEEASLIAQLRQPFVVGQPANGARLAVPITDADFNRAYAEANKAAQSSGIVLEVFTRDNKGDPFVYQGRPMNIHGTLMQRWVLSANIDESPENKVKAIIKSTDIPDVLREPFLRIAPSAARLAAVVKPTGRWPYYDKYTIQEDISYTEFLSWVKAHEAEKPHYYPVRVDNVALSADTEAKKPLETQSKLKAGLEVNVYYVLDIPGYVGIPTHAQLERSTWYEKDIADRAAMSKEEEEAASIIRDAAYQIAYGSLKNHPWENRLVYPMRQFVIGISSDGSKVLLNVLGKALTVTPAILPNLPEYLKFDPNQRFGLFVEKIQEGPGYGRDKYSIDVIKLSAARLPLPGRQAGAGKAGMARVKGARMAPQIAVGDTLDPRTHSVLQQIPDVQSFISTPAAGNAVTASRLAVRTSAAEPGSVAANFNTLVRSVTAPAGSVTTRLRAPSTSALIGSAGERASAQISSAEAERLVTHLAAASGLLPTTATGVTIVPVAGVGFTLISPSGSQVIFQSIGNGTFTAEVRSFTAENGRGVTVAETPLYRTTFNAAGLKRSFTTSAAAAKALSAPARRFDAEAFIRETVPSGVLRQFPAFSSGEGAKILGQLNGGLEAMFAAAPSGSQLGLVLSVSVFQKTVDAQQTIAIISRMARSQRAKLVLTLTYKGELSARRLQELRDLSTAYVVVLTQELRPGGTEVDAAFTAMRRENIKLDSLIGLAVGTSLAVIMQNPDSVGILQARRSSQLPARLRGNIRLVGIADSDDSRSAYSAFDLAFQLVAAALGDSSIMPAHSTIVRTPLGYIPVIGPLSKELLQLFVNFRQAAIAA